MSEQNGDLKGLGALSRYLRAPVPAAAAGERCELCSVAIESAHSHLVDVKERRLLCACRPCYLLFTPRGAAQGRYKAVGDRCVRFAEPVFSGEQWERLGIPINLAFFFFNSEAGKMVAFYPGPAGAAESLLPLDVWAEVASGQAPLAGLEPDVEALLVYRRKDGEDASFIVPIDACYELVGLMRSLWKGFDGGADAWQAIDGFFERLNARSGGLQAQRIS